MHRYTCVFTKYPRTMSRAANMLSTAALGTKLIFILSYAIPVVIGRDPPASVVVRFSIRL